MLLPSPLPSPTFVPRKGLVQAGKLRRSRPVLPPDSQMRARQSSPRENGGDTLPLGCTIVNRNGILDDANTNSKSVLTTHKVIRSSDARTGGTDTPTTDTTLAATAAAAAAVVTAAAAAADNLNPADSAGLRPSSADALAATPSAPSQRRSFGDEQAGGDMPPAAPRPSASNPHSASAADVAVSAAPTGAIDTGDIPSGMAATPAPARLKAPARREPMSGPRQKDGSTTTTTAVSARLVDAATPGELTRVLYNPGPTFRRARGRKKKTLLDASRVTADDIAGSEKVLALVADTTLQQVSLWWGNAR